MKDRLEQIVTATAVAHGFSGAVQVTLQGVTEIATAFGEADRAAGIRNTIGTRFGIASGTKLVTALAAGTLIDEGLLALDDALTDLVPLPLPGISAGVTVGHLLTHTSGVYDYLDEDAIGDEDLVELPIAPSRLLGPRDYLPMLLAGPRKFEPGERFSYSNGGYVLLGLALEEAAGRPFHELVEERVLRPCGMSASGFFRLDRLPANVATGYIRTAGGGWRTNADVLPVIGGPDGGMFATVGDIERLWRGLFDGVVLSPRLAESFVRKAVDVPGKAHTSYGHGMWIDDDGPGPPRHYLVGRDAGVSFRSDAHPDRTVVTVESNTSHGAWPMARALEDWLRRHG